MGRVFLTVWLMQSIYGPYIGPMCQTNQLQGLFGLDSAKALFDVFFPNITHCGRRAIEMLIGLGRYAHQVFLLFFFVLFEAKENKIFIDKA